MCKCSCQCKATRFEKVLENTCWKSVVFVANTASYRIMLEDIIIRVHVHEAVIGLSAVQRTSYVP